VARIVAPSCTWICDIAAFFVGRRWGNARLAPRISPGKSVEGATWVGRVEAEEEIRASFKRLETAEHHDEV